MKLKITPKKLLVLVIALISIAVTTFLNATTSTAPDTSTTSSSVDALPTYAGEPYSYLDDNIPTFTQEDFTTASFESYSELDALGRCGIAYACIGQDLMPTEDRGSISSVTPTGWEQEKYDDVDGGWLYNRSHMIGFQLTGENANKQNLITGTRAFNVDGMLPFENEVADYIHETGNHVLYRVTPYFDGDNLLADVVQIEAYSVEDDGQGVQFNVYCYNAQPGITIDYTTGNSYLGDTDYGTTTDDTESTTSSSLGDIAEQLFDSFYS